MRWLLVAGSMMFVAACSSDSQVDIGDGATTQGLSAYAHTWDGHAEAWQFGDGSDRVRVTLDGAGQGTIRLGDSAPLALPVAGDPPPPYAATAETDFAFEVEARLEDERLRFEINEWQRYQAWCELQTPVLLDADYPDVYACHRLVRTSQGNADGTCVDADTGEVALCDTLTACSDNCVCTRESCQASPLGPIQQLLGDQAPAPGAFDGALSADGQELTGTLVLHGAKDRVTVRLRRQ